MSRGWRQRRREIPPASLQVTSMMDMFTILLLFLLNFFDPHVTEEGKVNLPSSSSTTELSQGFALTILPDQVLVGDQLVLTLGSSIDTTPLYEHLARQRAGLDGAAPLTIRCDRRVPFSTLDLLLTAIRDAGFAEFRFVVLHDQSSTPD